VARITLYVVQTFVETDDGLVAEESFECQSSWEATQRASALALIKDGVTALAKSGDPDTGEWDDDPEILFQAGRNE
jgi:hypothetical protein